MRGITVALQKGGVGKTSIAINLAERLAARGNDVVLVDVDPQGSATEGVGQGEAYTSETHLGHALDPDDRTGPLELARPAAGDTDFDVVPSNAGLADAATAIGTADNGEARLYRHVGRPLGERYDWVVFDTPPTIGPLSNSALVASRRVVVPVQLTEPSADALTRTVTQQLFPLSERLADRIEIVAIVPNRVKGDNEETRVLRAIEDSSFGQYLPPFARSSHVEDPESPGPGIRERVAFRRAYRDGVPVATHDPDVDMLERLEELAAVVEDRWTPPGSG